MKNLSLKGLYSLLEKMEIENAHVEVKEIKRIIDIKEKLLEDNGGAFSSGVGAVTSSQPSSLPGALNGSDWAGNGGSVGSGDISMPYNTGSSKKVFQKFPLRRKKQSDPNVITKKYREKPLDIKSIKNMMSSRKKSGKIMNFSDFENKDITTKVTKIKEGITNKSFSSKDSSVKISSFQGKIESHVLGLGARIKQVGTDFEINYGGERIAQVMFRADYIGVKKTGEKFDTQFKYSELGKVKEKLTDIVKKATKLSKDFGDGWIEKF